MLPDCLPACTAKDESFGIAEDLSFGAAEDQSFSKTEYWSFRIAEDRFFGTAPGPLAQPRTTSLA